jgi:hypothetical protein
MDASDPYCRLNFPLNDSKGATGTGMTSGIFESSELSEMRAVFEEISSQPWFSRDPDAREAFGRYLFKNYPDGSFDPIKHRSAIEEAARQYFSNVPPENR